MCGLAGLLGVPPELAQPAAARMLAAMQHRGPDDCGTQTLVDPAAQAPPAVLTHARLSVQDLSRAGRQPMADSPGQPGGRPNWIVFNGEIFNFRELQKELAHTQWPCKTRCDTEVILHAYRTWGDACVQRMRGMFAWCLFDHQRGTAWLCRDRLGIKPLYLIRPRSGGLLFASELRTLLAAGPELVPTEINPVALESFLAQGAVCGLESIVRGVELLPPGTSLVTDWSGQPELSRKYWNFPFDRAGAEVARGSERIDRRRVTERLSVVVHEAVRLQLVADVPLGLFLSGGTDSSVLATVATEVSQSTLRTISIGFEQPEFDETEAAAVVARALGADHRSSVLTGQKVTRELDEVLRAVDQPTVDGFNTYFVSRAARRAGLKVALSGLGGDELFGGYATFRDVPRALRLRQKLRWLGRASRALAAAMVAQSRGRRGVKTAEMLRRQPSPLQFYLLRRELFLPAERRALHLLPEESDVCSGLPIKTMDDWCKRSHGLDVINQVSLFELGIYMQHMLLRDADVFSMAHGLEVRVPLLDHKLVEEVVALPGAWKLPDPRPKPLLVDTVGARLPNSGGGRRKRGFTLPWDVWLRGPLHDRVTEAMEDRKVWSALGLNPMAPTRLWERFLRGDRRIAALQVLALVVLGDFTSRHGLTRAA